jgi:hypothetical protein
MLTDPHPYRCPGPTPSRRWPSYRCFAGPAYSVANRPPETRRGARAVHGRNLTGTW